MKHRNWTNIILWFVYLSLLAVLLPHTAWAFDQFEPETAVRIGGITLTAWLGALAFEAAIATLTHKLAQHIERLPRIKGRWRRFSAYYLNAYALGLVVAVVVSALANLAHAVEYGRQMEFIAGRSWLFAVYVMAFGAILPFVSLLFARVLSNVAEANEADTAVNPELEKANGLVADLRRQVREANNGRMAAEQQAVAAEQRAQAIGDMVVRLFSENARERILAARERWPRLTQSGLAVITETSPSYVSEVLRDNSVMVEG